MIRRRAERGRLRASLCRRKSALVPWRPCPPDARAGRGFGADDDDVCLLLHPLLCTSANAPVSDLGFICNSAWKRTNRQISRAGPGMRHVSLLGSDPQRLSLPATTASSRRPTPPFSQPKNSIWRLQRARAWWFRVSVRPCGPASRLQPPLGLPPCQPHNDPGTALLRKAHVPCISDTPASRGIHSQKAPSGSGPFGLHAGLNDDNACRHGGRHSQRSAPGARPCGRVTFPRLSGCFPDRLSPSPLATLVWTWLGPYIGARRATSGKLSRPSYSQGRNFSAWCRLPELFRR